MAVKQIRKYHCDLCSSEVPEDELTRLGVRRMGDRPEDADNVDVCTLCADVSLVRAVILTAATLREGGNGHPA